MRVATKSNHRGEIRRSLSKLIISLGQYVAMICQFAAVVRCTAH